MTRARRHSDLIYRLELLVIRLRDLIRSPAKVLREAGMRAGMTVLDFGCGPGGFSLAAARLAGPGGQVYALDMQPLALESVRRAAARRGIGNVQPIDGSCMAEVLEGSVDMVLLFDVLHTDPQPDSTRAVLAAVHRVLKPQGMLSVRDHHLRDEALVDMVTCGGLFAPVGEERGTFRFGPVKAGEVAT
jgi:predicted methyltransferase